MLTRMNIAAFCLAAIAAGPAALAGGDKDRDVIILKKGVALTGDTATWSYAGDHAVAIQLNDGRIAVNLDGEEIPMSRLRIEDGRIVILDENGDEIEAIELRIGAGAGIGKDFAIAVGPGTGNAWFAENAEPPPVMLGIHLGEPGEPLRHHLRLDPGESTMITGLYEGHPACDAGLELYDVIIAIDGERPASPADLREALSTKKAGDEVKLTVIQEGRTKEITVTLKAYDLESMQASKLIGGGGVSSIFVPDATFEYSIPEIKGMDSDKWRNWIRQFQEKQGIYTAPSPWRGERRELDERMGDINDRIEEIREMLDKLTERAGELSRDRGSR